MRCPGLPLLAVLLGLTVSATALADRDDAAKKATPDTAEAKARQPQVDGPMPLVNMGPSRLLLTSGAITFGLTYASAAYVGLASSRREDRSLVVPFGGPWIDLARRPGCEPGRCDDARTNIAIIVADGLLQAGGAALAIIAVFEREIVPIDAVRRVALHVVPTPGGLGAFGTFD